MNEIGKSNIVSSFDTINRVNPKSESTFILEIGPVILKINSFFYIYNNNSKKYSVLSSVILRAV